MKVLIIEDEPYVARDLEKLILQVMPEAEVLGVISSVEGARKWFSENIPPELIFSDVQLSDGISFEIFESLHVHSPIIFTTAYDEYAVRAFKLNSIDYLLKPIDARELEKALLKYQSISGNGFLAGQLKELVDQWSGRTQKKYKERFLTLHRNTMVPVTQDEIAYFHKEELIYLFTMENEKYLCDHQTLDEVEALLNPEIFFRGNRQFIIHIQTIGRIRTTHKGLTVQLKPPFNLEVDISREKAGAFKNWIG